MDPFAIFALTFGMAIAASHQAAIMEHHAARAQYPYQAMALPAWESAPLAYPPPAPVPGWLAGAHLGSQVGALASASNPVIRCRGRGCGVGFDPRPIVAGAVIGGLVGHAASQPPAIVVQAAEPPPAPRSNPWASRAFQDHWQNFMQPSASR